MTSVPSFHNKHLLGGGVSFEAAAPPAWAGGLRRAPVGSGVQGPNGQAPRSNPKAATDAGSDASRSTRGRSEVAGEPGARVWRSSPGPRRPLQLRSGSLRSKEARRPGPGRRGARPQRRSAAAGPKSAGTFRAAGAGWAECRARGIGSSRERGWPRSPRTQPQWARKSEVKVSRPRRRCPSLARPVGPASGAPAASSLSSCVRSPETQRVPRPPFFSRRGRSLGGPASHWGSRRARFAERRGPNAWMCEPRVPKPVFPGHSEKGTDRRKLHYKACPMCVVLVQTL